MARNFGGDWTERKLDVVEAYLRDYLTALKNQRHWMSLGYIDAFAGDGSIQLATSETEDDSESPLIEIEEEIGRLIRGSAVRAIELEPGFDGYVLIEQDDEAAQRLLALRADYPDKNIRVFNADANAKLGDLCRRHDWSTRRAVVFLDPTGMQVEWPTMEALASTKAVDVWIWFPLGVGANRLLTRDGKIPPGWQRRLDSIFGTTDWREQFYSQRQEHTLFGPQEVTEKVGGPLAIAKYYNERLEGVFPAVASNPCIMRNSRNNPIYLLCFASANPKGGEVAVRIAQHLLENA